MTEQANAFIATLGEVRSGELLRELHHALVNLTGQVRSVGKKGTLTLKVNVALASQGSSQVLLTDEIKVTEPEPAREITILFADDENRLSRRDPRQQTLSGLERAERPRPVPFTPPARTSESSE